MRARPGHSSVGLSNTLGLDWAVENSGQRPDWLGHCPSLTLLVVSFICSSYEQNCLLFGNEQHTFKIQTRLFCVFF